MAPDPATHPETIVQVDAARASSLKEICIVYSCMAFQQENALACERYEAVGWSVSRSAPAICRNMRVVDGFWVSPPRLFGAMRGAAAARAMSKIEAAIASYSWPKAYRTWTRPNAKTFIAWILRETPDLGFEIPANAIGRDSLRLSHLVAGAPSGTSFLLALLGLFGSTPARHGGLELLLLGVRVGIDPGDLSRALPVTGEIGAGAHAVRSGSTERAEHAR